MHPSHFIAASAMLGSETTDISNDTQLYIRKVILTNAGYADILKPPAGNHLNEK